MAQTVTRTTTWTCDQCGASKEVADDPVAPADWIYVQADGHSVWFDQATCASEWLAVHHEAGRPPLDINLPSEPEQEDNMAVPASEGRDGAPG